MKKTQVYICRGCDIGSSLDVEALEKAGREDRGVVRCESRDCLCDPEGMTTIRAGLGDCRSVVIAACSSRFHGQTFAFEGCATERVNLREMVVWSHEPNDEDTQMLAEDYLRMGVTRALKAEIPIPAKLDVTRTVLVVGGGPTGMAAAVEAAGAGHAVVLVEREGELGGWLRHFKKVFPKSEPYRDAEVVDLPARIREIHENPRIKVLTLATIQEILGQPGQFDCTVKVGESAETSSIEHFRVGAIVQATGWKPYDASRLGHLGRGVTPDVITNVEMERLLAAGRVLRPSDGRPAHRVAFVQCAGSRDEAHLPYCSTVCCRVSLKQALWVRELDPDAEAYILYKDIRAPGQFEDFYRRAQEDPGIFFTKGDVTGVGADLRVHVENSLLGPKIEIEADLVVLATGMVPMAADGEAIRQVRDAQTVIRKGETGVQLEAARKTVADLGHHEGTDLLRLGYRQGPDLPSLKYGFPDSHFICFPYETRRTGIYAAGCVRAPNDTEGCRADAEGAALKAIQCLELAARGAAVHPRWEDLSFADFHMQRCTSCKRCTEECPFGALDEDEKGTPKPNPSRCRRCGICLGACPERIISFADYSPDIVSSMIKAVQIPDEFEEKPRLLVLLCENDAWPALDTAGFARIRHSAWARVIPVRCLGAVNVIWIADALARGFDGILLVGCKSGDDYQCHFVRGSELMGTRSDNIRQKLLQLALEEERVRVEQLAISEFHRLPAIIDEFAAQIDAVGLNPFKDM